MSVALMFEFGAGSVAPAASTKAAPSSVGDAMAPTWRSKLCLALAALALWGATRPYAGIVHDARLYAVGALEALYPGRYANDIYFRYGSQDRFSIFTLLYEPVISALGLNGAHLMLEGLGACLWLAATYAFTRVLLDTALEAALAFVGVLCLLSGYGGIDVFSYGEGFVSPRLFAESGVIAAIAAFMGRRTLLAMLFLGLGAAFHLISALVGGAVIFILLVVQPRWRRLWLLPVVASVIGVGLAVSNVAPFDRLLVSFDPAWFKIVLRRCDFVFVSRWLWWDLLRVANIGAVIFIVWRFGRPIERRLAMAIGIANSAALACSVIGGDLLGNVLIVDLQLWRALWLATFLANAFLPVIILRAKTSWSRDLLIIAVLFQILVRIFVGHDALISLMSTLALIIFIYERNGTRPIHIFFRLLAIFVTSVFIASGILFAVFNIPKTPRYVLSVVNFTVACISAWLVFCSCRVDVHRNRPSLLLVCLALSVFTIDGRSRWRRAETKPEFTSGAAMLLVGSGATYWEGEDAVNLMWFGLGRPSYYSCLQGTGSIFFRNTALDWDRRGRVLSRLATFDFTADADRFCRRASAPEKPHQIPVRVLAGVCNDLPDLDTVVLGRPVIGAPSVRTWTSPAPERFNTPGGRFVLISRFYRYDCRPYRPSGGVTG